MRSTRFIACASAPGSITGSSKITCCAEVKFSPLAPRGGGISKTRASGSAADPEAFSFSFSFSSRFAANASTASRSFLPPPPGCATATPFARSAAAVTRSASSHSLKTRIFVAGSAPLLFASKSHSARRVTASIFVPHEPFTTTDASNASCSCSVPRLASMSHRGASGASGASVASPAPEGEGAFTKKSARRSRAPPDDT